MSVIGILLTLITGCDCEIEGRRSYGHWVGSYDVLWIDETDHGLSGQQKEDLDNSIALIYSLQEEFLGPSISIPYSHTEIHVRDDYIPCRYGSYSCHGCSAVGYVSNGGPFIWISTLDNCSPEYLVASQLDRLVPEVLGYDYREFNLVEDICGAQINRCALARRRLERTTVYGDHCNE